VHPTQRVEIFDNISTPFGTLALHAKFGDHRLSRSSDITAGIEIENGSYDLDHDPFGCGLSSKS